MPVLEASLNPAYLMGALIFLVVVAMALIRQKEVNAISKRFDKDEILLASFAVTFYGVESENKKPLRIQGALVLTQEALIFQSRFGDNGFELPLSSFTGIGTTDTLCGKNLHQTVIAITFVRDGSSERAGYRIPHPAKWVKKLQKVRGGDLSI